jgi:ABC-type phosphate/phosphonate transport system substrate-binding protein
MDPKCCEVALKFSQASRTLSRMETLRFAFSGSEQDARILLPLTEFLSVATNLHFEPVPLANYPALYEALRSGWCAVGWLPPLVGHDLSVCRIATPLVAASRDIGSTYFSGFIASERSGIWHLGQLAGKRVGWVSKLSAAGYVVPRLHLSSVGIEPEGLFASEKMYGTHDAVRRALEMDCDVIATYLETGYDCDSLAMSIATPHRIVATSGPIPSDVISARDGLSTELCDRISRALLAFEPETGSSLTRVKRLLRFTPISTSHWSALERWQDRSRRESERVRQLSRDAAIDIAPFASNLAAWHAPQIQRPPE